MKSQSSQGGNDLIEGCRKNLLNNFEVNLATKIRHDRSQSLLPEKRSFHIRLNQTEQDKERSLTRGESIEEEKKAPIQPLSAVNKRSSSIATS